jgi:F-type H+-transporting ATPase subunit delta
MASLSARYASALFDLALESGETAGYRDEAAMIKDALSDEDCRRVLEHPHITGTKKKEFIDSIFAGRISKNLLGFLHLVIDKNRVAYLVPGLAAFIERLDQLSGRAGATVVSANELSEKQVLGLNELIGKKLGKKVEANVQVDPSVIGGFYVHADGYLLDYTIKKRLREMKVSLQRSYGS